MVCGIRGRAIPILLLWVFCFTRWHTLILPCFINMLQYHPAVLIYKNLLPITEHVYNYIDLLHPFMFCSTTTTDGRGGFLSSSSLQAGAVYKLFFDTDCYFKNIGVKGFYPYVEVKFNSKFTTLCSYILHVCFIGEYSWIWKYSWCFFFYINIIFCNLSDPNQCTCN